MKVKVKEPFRVVHEGEPNVGGDELEVPDDRTTATWIRARWAEPVQVSQTGKYNVWFADWSGQCLFPTTGAEPTSLYGVVTSGTATVSFASPG